MKKKKYISPTIMVCHITTGAVMTTTSITVATGGNDYEDVDKETDDEGSLWGD